MRWIALSLVLTGCLERTEVVVGVATDLKARGQIDLVTFTASRGGTPIIEHSWPLADLPADQYELPGSFGLYSPDGSEVRVELSVKGFRGDLLVTQRDSIINLVSGKTLFMRMAIVGDCGSLSRPICGAAETCVEGVCRAVEVAGARLPAYQKELVDHVACDSGTFFVISSTGLPMPMLESGAGCASDEYCQEGTCYKLLASEDGALEQGLWTQQPSGTTSGLRALWGTPDGADVFAVGDRGTILHLTNGGDWVLEESGTDANLYAVHGSSAGDVWAAGADGSIVHRGPAGWSAATLPVPVRIQGLWGNWAVGRSDLETGRVLRYSGAAWQPVHTAGDLRGLFAAADDDAWIVGHGSTVIHALGGSFTTPAAPAGDWFAVAGGYIVGRGGMILKDLTAESSGVSVDLFHVWASGEEVFVVGDYGTVLHREGGAWVRQPAETAQPLFAVWGSLAGDLYAAGRDGVLLHSMGQMGGCGSCPDGYVCAGLTCLTSCAGDGDCQAGYYCDATSACAIRKAQGSACNETSDCKEAGCRLCTTSLFCTDGVCCDMSPVACGGCQQCSAPTGTCGPVPNGQDPHGQCATATGECQQTSCNGQGGCGSSGDPCGTTSCAAGTLTTNSCLSGVCTAAPQPCPAPPTCADGVSCVGACATDTDCLATEYCDNFGLCRARKAQGNACNTTTHCKESGCRECDGSFSCIDGYCCNGPCSGKCQACDITNFLGTCSNVPSGQPHGSRGLCPGAGPGADGCAQYCDGSGAACHQTSGVCNTASCAGDGHTLNQAASCDTTTGTCPARVAYDCGMDRRTCSSNACRRCNLGGTCPSQYPVCNATAGLCGFSNGGACTSSDECGSNICVPETKTCCNADCPPETFACDTRANPSIGQGYFTPTSCARDVGLCEQQDGRSCNGYICVNRECLTSCTCAVGPTCISANCAPGWMCRGNTGDGTCYQP